MRNPIRADSFPLDDHHIARQDLNGPRNLIDRSAHQVIHRGETEAVQRIFRQDGLSGKPTAWTAKVNER